MNVILSIGVTLINNFTILFGIFLVSMLFVPPSIPPVEAQHSKIPAWIKNTAGWWATDTISETEFVNAIEFLVKEKHHTS